MTNEIDIFITQYSNFTQKKWGVWGRIGSMNLVFESINLRKIEREKSRTLF